MALPSNKVLAEYLQSPTWSNSRDLLKLHPELLDPAVDVLVERMIGYARDEHNEMGRGELEQQLGLLRRSRQVGADAAFAELSGQPRSYVVVEDQEHGPPAGRGRPAVLRADRRPRCSYPGTELVAKDPH